MGSRNFPPELRHPVVGYSVLPTDAFHECSCALDRAPTEALQVGTSRKRYVSAGATRSRRSGNFRPRLQVVWRERLRAGYAPLWVQPGGMQQSVRGAKLQAMSRLVLVVDDDADIREAIQEVLEADGFDVMLASNGAEALAILERGVYPSLILLERQTG